MKKRHFRSLADMKAEAPIVLTLGKFDGVHRGHQSIIHKLVEVAEERNATPAIWSFSSVPGAKVIQRILPEPIREMRLKESGAELLLVMDPDPKLFAMSAGDFLKDYLVERLNVQGIVLGENARLGKDRATSAKDFSKMAEDAGLAAAVVTLDEHAGTAISSTRIRDSIITGDFGLTAALLGREYETGGPVVKGKQIGRKLGFPTANICLDGFAHPPTGVYACKVNFPSGFKKAIAYIGDRPSIERGGERLLEVHIPDFDGNLYDQCLQVSHFQFLRPQMIFSSKQDLATQIRRDLDSF